MKALLLENVHPEGVRVLRERGVEVETRDHALGEDELIAALSGVHLLGLRSATHVTRRVFEASPELAAVGAFCIGTNQIDLDAATASGVPVFNAPYSNTRSVVELVLCEIIALARRLPGHNQGLHNGVWNKSAAGSHEVRGRSLGIVGYGNIGSQLSVLAEALGMTVYFYDVVDKLALGNARRCGSLEELLATVETVSVHVDGRPGNRLLFGAAQFAAMRPRSLFLNLSRGSVVDDVALAASLRSGHLAGAALDVYPTEPKSNGEEFVSPLRGLPNVILTPHVGGSTQEAQENIGLFVAGKLADFATSGATVLSVNFPQVQVTAPSERRILHLHANVPGVLAKINTLVAGVGANIDAQQLATRGQVGYAVLDINAEAGSAVLDALRAMPETIRVELR